jgi:chemotaxis response regulator CheB
VQFDEHAQSEQVEAVREVENMTGPRPIRVLVVDDSLVVRSVLTEILRSNAGTELVGTAQSGEAALVKIPQLKPDVITLDIEMPGMNGLQTLTQIRKLYPKLPVIMFSTLTEHGASATLEALALGATDYAAKPTSSEGLPAAREQIQSELIAKILALRAPILQSPHIPVHPPRKPPPHLAPHRHRCHRHFDRRPKCSGGSNSKAACRFSGSGRDRPAHASPVHAAAGEASERALR